MPPSPPVSRDTYFIPDTFKRIETKEIQRIETLSDTPAATVFKAMHGEVYSQLVAVKVRKLGSVTLQQRVLAAETAIGKLSHRNVVKLIGIMVHGKAPPHYVCTLCENGPLSVYLPKRVWSGFVPGREPALTQQLMGFAMQIASGLNYLHGRDIVHRNIRCSSILVDSARVCRISGCGSHGGWAHPGIGTEISARWCAPEVMDGSLSYTGASDVFAFGVTLDEIFAGSPPAHPGPGETSEPEPGIPHTIVIPDQVATIKQACQQQTSADRPSMESVKGRLDMLGAVGGEAKSRNSQTTYPAIVLPPSACGPYEAAAAIDIRAPSVHHLCTVLLPECHATLEAALVKTQAAGAALGRDGKPAPIGTWGAVEKAADASISHMVFCHTNNRTLERRETYVDSIAHMGPEHVGGAAALLSYSWGYKLGSVVSALRSFCGAHNKQLTEQYIWICSLCLNQHTMLEGGPNPDLEKDFGSRVQSIGRVLPMFEPYDNPGYLKRLWCLFELFTSIKLGGNCVVDVIFSEAEQARLDEAILMNTAYTSLDSCLSEVDSGRADATVDGDRWMIQAAVARDLPGGFAALDALARREIMRWFEDNGIMRSSTEHYRNESPRTSIVLLPPSREFEQFVPAGAHPAAGSNSAL